MAPRKHHQIGDKIFHQDYGPGMVVEVRPRPFFDILEVAFADGVRKLNSNHPKITESPEPAPQIRPARPRMADRPRRRGSVRTEELRTVETAPGRPHLTLIETAPAEVEDEETDEAPTESWSFSEPDSLILDVGSLEDLLAVKKPPADGGAGFLWHLQAERLSLTRGFEKLLALSAVRDLERYEFQIQACLRVLRQMRGRALLADEVGLGKTIEAGLIMKEYVLRGLVRRALVLTPVSLMSQWREELQHKFDLPFEIRARGQGWNELPFLIASIDTAKTEKNRDDIGAAGFDMLVVDEAHRLRNHLTQGWKFVDALSLKYLLLLTATPVQNDLRELYNLITLLKPGLLETYRSFRREYMVRGDKRLPKNTQKLARTLSQVMVRTSRSSTAITFPKREVNVVAFEMTRPERRLYDAVADFIREVAEESDPKEFPRWQFLLIVLQKEMGSSTRAAAITLERSKRVFRKTPFARKLNRLIQLSREVTTQAKLQGLRKLIGEFDGDQLIVFTQFRRTLEYLEEELRKDGLDPVVFHGSLTANEKDQAVEAFRSGRQVLLSTEAGGEGRNLQFCRTMVNYDLPWNPMRIEQRIGRIHRLGQTRDTRIFNFTARDTVEDYVMQILDKKIHLFEAVVGEMDMVLGHWDRESFEHEVFKIWASHRNIKDREAAYENLGEQLGLAHKRHERVKEFDDSIFTRLDSTLGLGKGDGGGS